MMNRLLLGLVPLAVAIGFTTTGCCNTWSLSRDDLRPLQGFRAPQTVKLTNADGEKVPFDGDTWLTFTSAQGYQRYRFAAISAVDDKVLAGTVVDSWLTLSSPQGYENYRLPATPMSNGSEPASTVKVDLRPVTAIEANKLSPSRTAGAVIVSVAAFALVVGVFAAVSSIKSYSVGY